MKNIILLICLLLFTVSCGVDNNFDNTEEQSIIEKGEVETKGLGITGNTGALEVEGGFNN